MLQRDAKMIRGYALREQNVIFKSHQFAFDTKIESFLFLCFHPIMLKQDLEMLKQD